jgi:ATP/maltotriose-dependent transcriptional regulator MalT
VLAQDGAVVELEAGDPAAAESELRKGYAVLAELAESGFRSTNAALLAEALVLQGRLDDAADAAADALELAKDDDFITVGVARQVQARVLAARGEFEAAATHARQAVAVGERSDYLYHHANALVCLAYVCEAAGDSSEAAEAAQKALGLYEQKGAVVGAARARAVLERLGAGASAG